MPESLEIASLRALAKHIGARVTSTNGDTHSPTSFHYAAGTLGTGLAVDLAETRGPSALTPGLKRIADEVARLVGPRCAELIYAEGPCLRNGKPFAYGPLTLRAHRNHVHVAVARGFRFEAPAPPAPEVRPMFSPPLQIAAVLDCPTGGVWAVAPDGAIFAFGGAPYLGGANGKPYFVGRTAARLDLVDGKYRIIATSGEGYGPGF